MRPHHYFDYSVTNKEREHVPSGYKNIMSKQEGSSTLTMGRARHVDKAYMQQGP